MKNGDVRGACLAIIRNRVGGPAAARAPRPAALGLRLQRGDLPPGELAALCAAVLRTLPRASGAAAERRWEPSAALRALLGEYHRVQAAPPRPHAPLNGFAVDDAAHAR
ncbi:MAG: hypothetical protein SF182_18510 [Deltaproteobacteria bacterium]|nr:hypothetical protein [Deltaproteobacteria bacterium]